MASAFREEAAEAASVSSAAISEFQGFLEGLLSSLDARKPKRFGSTLGIDNLDDKADDEEDDDEEREGSQLVDEDKDDDDAAGSAAR
jgi:hypothetical protein